MNKLIFTLIILHCSLLIAEAQWYSVDNGSSGYVHHISFKDENTGWYIADRFQIYKTTNGGVNWRCIDIPYIDTLDNFGPIINSSDTIWISANGDRILKSVNGGNNWVEIHNNLNGKIIGFSLLRQNLIYGILKKYNNSSGYLVRSTNGGLNWLTVSNLNYDYSENLNFINDSIGFCKAFGSIFKTTNSGINWQNILTDTPYVQYDYMKFIDVNLGFLVKSISDLYRTTNGGYNWQYIFNCHIRDVSFIDNNTGYMVGDMGYNRFYKTTNRGLTWDSLYTGKNRIFLELVIIGNTFYINGCYAGSVLKSTNNGINWIDLTPYFNANSFYTISFANSQNGFIGAHDMFLLRTTNTGNNWFIDSSFFKYNKKNPSNFIKFIQFTDENTGWLLADSGLFKTTNSGMNWNKINVYTFKPQKFYFINNNIGWLINDSAMMGQYYNAVYKTTNGGNNFAFQNIVHDALSDIKFYDSLYGYISCNDILGGPNLYRTTDGGNSWKGIELGPISSVCIIDRYNTIISQDLNGGIYKTSNGGENWFKVFQDTLYWNCIKFINQDTGFVVNGEKNIFYTVNGGNNWNYSYLGSSIPIIDIFFIPPNKAFLIGEFGKIYKTDNLGGIVGINNHNEIMPEEYYLYQNYPNPFNNTTKIKFEIPPQFSFPRALSGNPEIKLVIYNILGQEIATLINEQLKHGNYEVKFEGNNLPSGVYFYSLIIEGKINQTKKMLMIK